MRSSSVTLLLSLFVIAISSQFGVCSSTDGPQFNPAEAQVLRVFANAILDEMQSNDNFLAPVAASPAASRTPSYQRMPAKRNSELLNSLLGLPKNILKSGRK